MTVGVASGGGEKSTVHIFGNVFISFIGAGVLGLPYAFKEAGVLEGVVVMAAIAILSTRAMLKLMDCKERVVERVKHEHPMHELWPRESVESLLEEHNMTDWRQLSPHQQKFREKELDYADVAHYALGKRGKRLVEVSLVVSQVGFSCAYLIFIQENLAHYLPSVSQHAWLLPMLPVLVLLCLYRNINSLAYFSIVADLANVFAYCIVFYFDFSHTHKVPIHPKTMTLEGLPFFIGVAIYCYEGAGLILVLQASVPENRRDKFRNIFKSVMVVVTGLYISFGAAGYLSFGQSTRPIITLNLPHSLFPHLVKACLCFSLFFTYPVMMFPVVQLLEAKLIADPPHHRIQGNILRGLLVGLTGLIVIAIPNFSVLMALVGSTCCTLLAFILPAVLHLFLFESEIGFKDLVFNYFIIFIGVLGALIGTWDAICRLIPSLSFFSLIDSITTTLIDFTH